MTQINEVNESQIATHWKEEESISPSAEFVAQANMADPAVFDRFSEGNFPENFTEYADLLSWDEKWHTTVDTSNPPFWKWWVGGKLNASYNCVDRHLEQYGNKAAFIWVSEVEDEPDQVLTYRDLWVKVNEFAALLRDYAGVKAGDRVTLHMPMVPELPVTMLACARLGVVHSQVFGGFSGTACGDRIVDSGSEVLILEERSAAGPQGQGRRSRRTSREKRRQSRQGTGLAPLSRQVFRQDADGRGPRPFRRRAAD